MTDVDVFGKLSRIFETHAFTKDDSGLQEILEDFDPSLTGDMDYYDNSPSRRSPPKKQSAAVFIPDRPTPFEVWKAKQKNDGKQKSTPKLSGQQWDKLVDKMHQSNRIKQSGMIKEQNQGLAHELGGFQFKPRINQTSLELSSTMKALHLRMPEMMAAKKKWTVDKVRDKEAAEVADCTFEPARAGGRTSDMILKRMGRDRPVTADDFSKYKEEKLRRNEARREIMQEIEEKDLTFEPVIGERSRKIQEKLAARGVIAKDPITRTTVVAMPDGGGGGVSSGEGGLTPAFTPNSKARIRSGVTASSGGPFSTPAEKETFEGPTLVVESEHPYRHNTCEYTTVNVPGAVSYVISFSEDTRTEAIHDFLRFYSDETHTDFYGTSKYSGGTNNTALNWPGVGNRPALYIPSSRFVIHFKTNGSVNDWGFKMNITPTLALTLPDDDKSANSRKSFVPTINESGKRYRNPYTNTMLAGGGGNLSAHERLYLSGVEKITEKHNKQMELVQTRLKDVEIKPWEVTRSHGEHQHKLVRANRTTHLPKYTIAEAVEELIVDDDTGGGFGGGDDESGVGTHAFSVFTVVQFEDQYNALWRDLRSR